MLIESIHLCEFKLCGCLALAIRSKTKIRSLAFLPATPESIDAAIFKLAVCVLQLKPPRNKVYASVYKPEIELLILKLFITTGRFPKPLFDRRTLADAARKAPACFSALWGVQNLALWHF